MSDTEHERLQRELTDALARLNSYYVIVDQAPYFPSMLIERQDRVDVATKALRSYEAIRAGREEGKSRGEDNLEV